MGGCGIASGSSRRSGTAALGAAGARFLCRGSVAADRLRRPRRSLPSAFRCVVHHRGPARLGADHLDQVAQETGTPGAVKGAEYAGFLHARNARDQVMVLGQHPRRQAEQLGTSAGPDLQLRCRSCGAVTVEASRSPCPRRRYPRRDRSAEPDDLYVARACASSSKPTGTFISITRTGLPLPVRRALTPPPPPPGPPDHTSQPVPGEKQGRGPVIRGRGPYGLRGQQRDDRHRPADR
jgi:hypothetical protein